MSEPVIEGTTPDASRVRDWPKAVIPLPPEVMAEVQRLSRANGLSLSEAVRRVLTDVGLGYLTSMAKRREGAKAPALATA